VKKIGILVPFFANDGYLTQLLDSLLSQTCPDWFALIIDDSGKTNGVGALVARYGEPRFAIIKNETNLGLSRCWNLGLKSLSNYGEFSVLAVVHADDELTPSYVQSVLDAHERYPDAVAVHTAVSVIGNSGRLRFSIEDIVKRIVRPGNGRTAMLSQGDKGLARVLQGNFIFCPTLSFKRSVVKFPFFLDDWKQVLDLELTSRLLLNGGKIVGLKKRLYRYRRHGANITVQQGSTGLRFLEEITLYQNLRKQCREAGFVKSEKAASKMSMIRLHCWFMLAKSVLLRDRETTRNLRKVLSVWHETRQ